VRSNFALHELFAKWQVKVWLLPRQVEKIYSLLFIASFYFYYNSNAMIFSPAISQTLWPLSAMPELKETI
jgi:hypothetical protein